MDVFFLFIICNFIAGAACSAAASGGMSTRKLELSVAGASKNRSLGNYELMTF